MAERREKIDTPRAERIRLRIFEHDPPLRELRSQLFKVGWLFPLLGRLPFDHQNIIEHETFLAIARKTQFAGEFLTRPQTIKLNRRARDVNVFGHGQEIQFRIAQQSEGIAHLIEKTFSGDRRALAELSARDVENVMMASARRMQLHVELGRSWQEFVAFLELVDAQLSRSSAALF